MHTAPKCQQFTLDLPASRAKNRAMSPGIVFWGRALAKRRERNRNPDDLTISCACGWQVTGAPDQTVYTRALHWESCIMNKWG